MANYGTKGWIKLWRNQMNTILYHNEPFDKWHAYIDLCLMADETGSVKTSMKALKTRWSWSHTRKVLDFLESDFVSDSVSVTRIPNKGTIIRINTGFSDSKKTKKQRKNKDFGSVSDPVSGFEEVSSKEDRSAKPSPISASTPSEVLKNSYMYEDDFDD